VGALVATAVLATGLVALNQYPRLSPVDELSHLDSVIKSSQGRWYLPPNERIGVEAMRIEACRGIDADYQPPPCSTRTLEPEDFQELGYNTAAGRPSAYYVVTGYLARIVLDLADVDFLTAGRVASLAAWAAGAGLLASVCARLARSVTAGAGIGLLFGVMPPALSQGVTVNPDSWALVAGTAVSILVLARERLRGWQYLLSLSLVLTIAVLLKPNFVVLALLPVLIAAHDALGARRWGPLLTATIPTAVALVVFLGSDVIIGRTPSLAPMSTYLRISDSNPWDWTGVQTSLLGSLVPVQMPGSVDSLESPVVTAAGTLAFLFCLGAALGALSGARRTSRYFAWSAAALLLLVAAPAIVYAGSWAAGVFFGYPSRYSLVVFPALGVAWALQSPLRPLVPSLVGAALLAFVLVNF
jgi:hypothetical protein